MRTTYIAKPADVKRKWFIVDAENQTLGRLASECAKILRGKHKPSFTPHVDCGDHIVVINAGKIGVTGKKLEQKIYRRHSMRVGGLKEVPLKTMLAKKPEHVFYLAVRGMLPKNALGRKMIKKLKVYAGSEHPHNTQKPEKLSF